jgi:Uncharacterized protein family UPF0004
VIPRHTPDTCESPGDTPPGPDELDRLRSCRVFIEIYGCRYNFGDMAKLVEILKGQDCTFAGCPEEADVVIVNTCTVVGPTERRMLRRLSALRDRELYVAGCMPVVQRGAIFAVCTPSIISPEIIYERYRQIGTVAPGSVGLVQLAQGCSGTCTYCLTRFARGPIQSFSKEEICGQVRACARAGGGVRHAPVIMSDLSAAALPGMTHGTADCINCLTGDKALEPGDFPAVQFVREPVAGEDKAQDAMAFDEKPGIRLPVSVRATPRYGVWWR